MGGCGSRRHDASPIRGEPRSRRSGNVADTVFHDTGSVLKTACQINGRREEQRNTHPPARDLEVGSVKPRLIMNILSLTAESFGKLLSRRGIGEASDLCPVARRMNSELVVQSSGSPSEAVGLGDRVVSGKWKRRRCISDSATGSGGYDSSHRR